MDENMGPCKIGYTYYLVKLYRKMVSIILRLKYWPFIVAMGSCDIGKGVKFSQMLIKGKSTSSLKLVLKGNNRIGSYSIFQGSKSILMGENSFCGCFCVFGSNDSIQIGENVMIADAVTIRDTDHDASRLDIPMIHQGVVTAPVIIEDDVWLAHGVSVLKGVCIGKGAIVAAGAVVIDDVPAYSIVGGVPAKVLRYRESRDV